MIPEQADRDTELRDNISGDQRKIAGSFDGRGARCCTNHAGAAGVLEAPERMGLILAR